MRLPKYALAEMLVLRTCADTWGLAMNDAVACGLPVTLSRAAGRASGLVRENWNELLATPRDVSSLTMAMRNLADQPDLCATTVANGAQRISNHLPNEWSRSIARMVEAKAVASD